MSTTELAEVHGRAWEDVDVSFSTNWSFSCCDYSNKCAALKRDERSNDH